MELQKSENNLKSMSKKYIPQEVSEVTVKFQLQRNIAKQMFKSKLYSVEI